MASHLYWRLYVVANNGDSGATTLDELQFRTAPGGASVATGGTATASDSLVSGRWTGPSGAFDGNTSTGWAVLASGGVWLRYQFASAVEIVEAAIRSRGDTSTQTTTPKDFLIQGSDDGTNWTSYANVAGETGWGQGELRTFSVGTVAVPPAVEGTHRYWRLYIFSNAQNQFATSIAEVEMAATSGGADQCTGGTASASTAASGSGAANAVANDGTTSFWSSTEAGRHECWWQYRFASAVDVREVRLTGRTGSQDNADQSPMVFLVQGSDDGWNWGTYAVCSQNQTWSQGETKTFAVSGTAVVNDASPSAAHRGWRIRVTAKQSGTTTGNVGVDNLDFSFGGVAHATGGGGIGPVATVNNTAERAFDAYDASGTSFVWVGAFAGGYCGHVFGSAVRVDQVALKSRPGNVDENPIAFALQFSDDLVTWTTKDSFTTTADWVASETRTFGTVTSDSRPAIFFIA